MRRKKANEESLDIKGEWVAPSTPEEKRLLDNGLKILARIIARAYTEEQKQQRHR